MVKVNCRLQVLPFAGSNKLLYPWPDPPIPLLLISGLGLGVPRLGFQLPAPALLFSFEMQVSG